VCFDFQSKENSNYKPNEFIYKMIETLLPKSAVDEQKKHLRMIELYVIGVKPVYSWPYDTTPRRGWIKIYE
jgi:hypothetical protein